LQTTGARKGFDSKEKQQVYRRKGGKPEEETRRKKKLEGDKTHPKIISSRQKQGAGEF